MDDTQLTFTIHGQTPAQKNGKSVGRVQATGRTFVASSPTVKKWQKESLEELNLVLRGIRFRSPTGRIKIDYAFYVKDDVQRDTDNMIASVNDLLQVVSADRAPDKKGKMKPVKKTGLIPGDHWQVLQLGQPHVEIDKENPRAVIRLSEYEGENENQWWTI